MAAFFHLLGCLQLARVESLAPSSASGLGLTWAFGLTYGEIRLDITNLGVAKARVEEIVYKEATRAAERD